jgi:hypothetical protein
VVRKNEPLRSTPVTFGGYDARASITRKENPMECEEFMEPEQDVEYDDDQ